MAREVELQIDDIAFGGKGVGRADGKAVFVPFTIEGERVTARVVREKKSFAEAGLVRLIETSPERVAPPCPYFGRCGGCSYQHMSYEHQLHWKSRQLGQALRRIGKIQEPPLRPIVPSPRDYAYRNRITVHAENSIVGFFRHDAHRLIDIERCAIAAPEVNEELAALRARRPRDGHYTLRTRSGPRVFSQTNDAVATHLADTIADLIPGNVSLLIDAYCGAGFFAKRAVAGIHRVVGIDWDVHAIAAAQADAGPTETYIAGEISPLLRAELAACDPRLTTVIVDPPAIGLGGDVREILRTHPVATLLYVSCNPPTLARDLGELGAVYRLESVTPFDMFPQTAEIEALAHLAL
ncbi:MAG TPA: TRAM domain-containing protein [Chthoniobacterales bacterium]|jgi:23S rRNA (uracil1939-C5)-methyltransferase|nr:TRAM domain-containing protein [Chthoniobacterales bacterium]